MCMDLTTNPVDLFVDQIAPEEMRNNLKLLQTGMKVLEGGNVDFNDLLPILQGP